MTWRAVGLLRQIRITLLWDVLGTALDDEQCRDAILCDSSRVVVPGNVRYQQIVERTEWAEAYFERALIVRKVQVCDVHVCE
jgi:hypothetical protein